MQIVIRDSNVSTIHLPLFVAIFVSNDSEWNEYFETVDRLTGKRFLRTLFFFAFSLVIAAFRVEWKICIFFLWSRSFKR